MILTDMERVIIDQYPENLAEAFVHFFRNKEAILQSPAGKYEACGALFYFVQEYETRSPEESEWESHKKYIDVHIICEGGEMMEFSDVSSLTYLKEDAANDCVFWGGAAQGRMNFRPGGAAVFYPEDAHKPGLCLEGQRGRVKKVVYKVLLE